MESNHPKVIEPAESPKSKLSKDQLQEQLDGFEAQSVQIKQTELLLNFDKEHFESTIERKERDILRKKKLIESNIEVIKKQLAELDE